MRSGEGGEYIVTRSREHSNRMTSSFLKANVLNTQSFSTYILSIYGERCVCVFWTIYNKRSSINFLKANVLNTQSFSTYILSIYGERCVCVFWTIYNKRSSINF